MNSARASTIAAADTDKAVATSPSSPPHTVLMDNDGHMDDLIALVVLSQLVGPALSSIVISQGNSETDIAAKTTAALLDYMGQKSTLVGASKEPAKNAFPDAWRAMSKDFHAVVERFLGESKSSSLTSMEKAHEKWLGELQISNSGLIVATGPLTNIRRLLSKLPDDLVGKVKLFWMGGALDAAGNVTTSDGTQISAEWNSYADPDSVAGVLKMGVELFIVPLDVTNHFEVTSEMIQKFRSAGTVLADIVAALLEYSTKKYNYYLWDPIASVLAVYPHFAEWSAVHISVEQNGKVQGRLYRSENGDLCHVAEHIRRDQITDKICESLGK